MPQFDPKEHTMLKPGLFRAGECVQTSRQLGLLPVGSRGVVIRSFVRSDLCAVRFEQRTDPRIVSRRDLELAAVTD
jgi:hypothetical protein